jgi:hypothetical protein
VRLREGPKIADLFEWRAPTAVTLSSAILTRQSWTLIHGRDRDDLHFGEQIPPDCHEACNCSDRRNPLKVLCVGLFGPSSAGRPFADNSKGASEAPRLQSAPEFSSISTAGRPLTVEPWQMQVQRTLPGPEDIVAFAANVT